MSHDFFDAYGGIYLVFASKFYEHFFSDKKFILLYCANMFFMRIFGIYAHLGVSIQRFYAIFQNAHKNRWMET